MLFIIIIEICNAQNETAVTTGAKIQIVWRYITVLTYHQEETQTELNIGSSL